MKKFKIFSLAVFPLLLGIMAGCSGGTSSSSEKSGSSSSATPSTSTVGPSTSSAEPVSSSSETPSPSSSSSSESPIPVMAMVTVGEEVLEMKPYTPGPDEAQPNEAYKVEGLDLTAGEGVLFTYDGESIWDGIEPEPGACNCDFNELTCAILVHNDAEDAAIYFKVWDEGYSFWITGYDDPTPATSGAYLMGVEGDWTIGEAFKPNELNPGEYVLEEFETNTTDALKVKFVPEEGELVWAGYSQVEEGCKSLVASDGTENDNFLFVEEGVYTIYYKPGENSIWIKNASPVPHEATVKIGEGEAKIMGPDETGEGQIAAFILENVDLAKDEAVLFSFDETEITTNIGSEPEDEQNKNNAVVSTGDVVSIKVHNDAEKATIYFKAWNDGGFSFWITGFEQEPIEVYLMEFVGEESTPHELKHFAQSTSSDQEYFIADFEPKLDARYKLKTGDRWDGISNVKDECASLVKASGELGDFAFNATGKYTLYWDLAVPAEGKSVWIALDTPATHTSTVKIGENEPIDMDGDTAAPGQIGAFKYEHLNLLKDETVVFSFDGTPITTKIGSEPEDKDNKNNAVVSTGEVVSIKVHNDAEDATISFKAWSDGGFSFWITGFEPEEVKALLKSFKGTDPAVDTELTENVDQDGEYFVRKFAVEADARYKLNLGDRWDGLANVKPDCAHLVEASGEQGDFKFKEVGKYDIYWDTNVAGSGESIWIQKVFESDIMMGGSVVQTSSFSYNKKDGNTVEYCITNAELDAGISLNVKFNNTVKEIAVEEAGAHEDFEVNAEKTQITLKSGKSGKYDFYLKEDITNGKLSMYIGKSPVEVTYTVTLTNEWDVYTAEAVMLVWNCDTNKAVATVKTGDKTFTFEALSNLSKFVVVRCKPGTTPDNFDWNTSVWNQSADVVCEVGTTMYTVSLINKD